MILDKTTLRTHLLRFEYEMCTDMFRNTKVTKKIIRKHLLYTAKNIVECMVPEVTIALSNYLQRYNIGIKHLCVIASMKERINYLSTVENQDEQEREIKCFFEVINILNRHL